MGRKPGKAGRPAGFGFASPGGRIMLATFPAQPMNILKTLLFVVVAIVALTLFGKIRQKIGSGGGGGKSAEAAARSAKDPGLSPSGFFLLKREEAGNPRVTIMSPPNCPSHEAQRARQLESELQAAGVPCEMKSEIAFTFNDPADAERINKYMTSVTNPLVLVRGWAKGNPTAEAVIAQYNGGK